MAFTVEDGTGVAGANAYISEAVADTHHADRGNTNWAAAASPDKQFSIVRATDYVDKRFGKSFRGFRETKAQGLEWPRLSAFDNDDYLYSSPDDRVPRHLQKAIAEYAIIALNLTLMPLPALPFSTRDPVTGVVTTNASGQVQRKKEKVGPIEEDTTFQNTTSHIVRAKPGASESDVVSAFNLPEYPVADEWLQELLVSGASIELRLA
jgi:hypothetical protein